MMDDVDRDRGTNMPDRYSLNEKFYQKEEGGGRKEKRDIETQRQSVDRQKRETGKWRGSLWDGQGEHKWAGVFLLNGSFATTCRLVVKKFLTEQGTA